MTTVLESGYCCYRRPEEQDGYVVATNFTLLEEFDCHINVEVCYTANVLKYVFKYLKKGTAALRAWSKINSEMDNDVDEIAEYIARRVLSAAEASWRIFGFNMKRQWPAVTQLLVHLPDQDTVMFNANNNDDVEKALCGQSPLERYLNRHVQV